MKLKELKRGDVFFADFGNKCRPYLVVQNDTGNHFSGRTIVVPLTTKQKKELPTHCVVCWGKIRTSVVQCEDITNVDVNPNWIVIETLPPEIMRHVDRCLKIAIGVE